MSSYRSFAAQSAHFSRPHDEAYFLDVGVWVFIMSTPFGESRGTRAKWMGVTPSEMPSVFPNIGNFNTRDLGFMT